MTLEQHAPSLVLLVEPLVPSVPAARGEVLGTGGTRVLAGLIQLALSL